MSEPSHDEALDWTRLHVVTPVLSAGRGLGVLLALGAAQMDALAQLREDAATSWIPLAILAVSIPLVVGITFAQWSVNQYRVDDDAVHQRRGLLFRQHLQARLDRLQAVDVVQPLVARVFGFAGVTVEVAGGQRSGVRLKYLRLADAEQLRNRILALAAGVDRGPAAPAPVAATAPAVAPTGETGILAARASAAAPDRDVYAVPTGRLLGSILASWWTVVLVVMVVLGIVALAVAGSALVDEIGREASAASDGGVFGFLNGGLFGVLSGFFAFFAYAWAQFSAGFGFTAGIAADGIRLRHGLLETRRQTVPPGRVQAVKLVQPLPWRRFDWWRITINVAGYQDNQAAVSSLLPVGPRSDALYALWLVIPDLGDPDPGGTVSAAMSGRGADNDFTSSPARAWIVDPFQWRRRGVRATGRALMIRSGLLVRRLVVVPHEKTQSLAIRQGPLQRALRLATVEVHSTQGTVRPVAEHLDVADALALVEAQAGRAREGRGRQTSEQWMARVAG